MKLIKNVHIYSPIDLGIQDVLISDSKIEKIDKNINFDCENLDGTNCILTPGFIDRHVHITGGGGEAGFISRAKPIEASEVLKNGITTVVGLLGTDGYTRSVKELFAKAKEMTSNEVHTYILTGSYAIDCKPLSQSLEDDLVFIDNIIGVKLALSDHRSSHVTKEELVRIAAKIRTASMIAGKIPILTLHMGDGKNGLKMIFEIIDEYDIPINLFQPTHVTRNPHLFDDAKTFAQMGGTIDMTCDGDGHTLKFINKISKKDKITISSDAQGSWSTYHPDGTIDKIGITPISNLKKEFCHLRNNLGYEKALPYFTSNVANVLGLKSKGYIQVGYDCDLILWKDNEIKKVISSK